MARVPYLSKEDLPPDQRDVLARDIALARALANSPNAARAFSGLGQFIRRDSRLDGRLRELAILQVGYLARSPYEWSHHIRIGREFGVTDADIEALIADTEGRPATLDPAARLVLRAAREMAAGPGMAAETFTALQEILGNERMIDLTLAIGFYCGVVRVLATLQIDVEPEYLPYLERFPLPAG